MVLRGHRQIPTQTMIHAQWDRRIRRATELTSTYPFAAEGLRFYARVATFQKILYAEIQKALADSPKISVRPPSAGRIGSFPPPAKLFRISVFDPADRAGAACAGRRRLGAEGAGSDGSGRSRISGTGISSWPRVVDDAGTKCALGEFTRGKSFRSIARMDFSSAVRRISCRPPRDRYRGRNSFDLSALRRQADRRRIAERRRRCEEVADLHALRARMGFSKDILSGVRGRERAADGVLFGAGNRARARGRLRHLPYLPEEHRLDEDGPTRFPSWTNSRQFLWICGRVEHGYTKLQTNLLGI